MCKNITARGSQLPGITRTKRDTIISEERAKFHTKAHRARSFFILFLSLARWLVEAGVTKSTINDLFSVSRGASKSVTLGCLSGRFFLQPLLDFFLLPSLSLACDTPSHCILKTRDGRKYGYTWTEFPQSRRFSSDLVGIKSDCL